MLKQNTQLGVRIEEKKLTEYLKFCEAHSYSMSKRIRKFIELDLALSLKNKDSISILLNDGKK